MKTLLELRIAWLDLLGSMDMCPTALWTTGTALLEMGHLTSACIAQLWSRSPTLDMVQVELSRRYVERHGMDDVQLGIERALEDFSLSDFAKCTVLSYIAGSEHPGFAELASTYDTNPYVALVQRVMIHEQPHVFSHAAWAKSSDCAPMLYLSGHRKAMEVPQMAEHIEEAISQMSLATQDRLHVLLNLCSAYIGEDELPKLDAACRAVDLRQHSDALHKQLVERIGPLNAPAYWVAWRHMDAKYHSDLLSILDCMQPQHFAMAMRDEVTVKKLMYMLLDTHPGQLRRAWASITTWCGQNKCSVDPLDLEPEGLYAAPWKIAYQLNESIARSFVQFQTMLDTMRVRVPSQEALALLVQHLEGQAVNVLELPPNLALTSD